MGKNILCHYLKLRHVKEWERCGWATISETDAQKDYHFKINGVLKDLAWKTVLFDSISVSEMQWAGRNLTPRPIAKDFLTTFSSLLFVLSARVKDIWHGDLVFSW